MGEFYSCFCTYLETCVHNDDEFYLCVGSDYCGVNFSYIINVETIDNNGNELIITGIDDNSLILTSDMEFSAEDNGEWRIQKANLNICLSFA